MHTLSIVLFKTLCALRIWKRLWFTLWFSPSVTFFLSLLPFGISLLQVNVITCRHACSSIYSSLKGNLLLSFMYVLLHCLIGSYETWPVFKIMRSAYLQKIPVSQKFGLWTALHTSFQSCCFFSYCRLCVMSNRANIHNIIISGKPGRRKVG